MSYSDNDERFEPEINKGEDPKRPYDLSKIEPIEPVPEDDANSMNAEFGALDTDLLGIQFIPNIAGTPPSAVPANPATYAYFQKMNEEHPNKRNLKE